MAVRRVLKTTDALADAIPPWSGLLFLAVVMALSALGSESPVLRLLQGVLAVLFVAASALTLHHRVRRQRRATPSS